jgi:hypothetical protein
VTDTVARAEALTERIHQAQPQVPEQVPVPGPA